MNDAVRSGASSSYAGLYVALNALFSLLVIVLGSAGDGANPRVIYLCLLMLVCSSPLLWLRQVNGRYVLLCVFLGVYLFYYGANDFASLRAAVPSSRSEGALSAAELAVLAGALMVVIGYRGVVMLHAQATRVRPARDFPIPLVLFAGFTCWAVGLICVWIWQVHFQTTAVSLNKEFESSTVLVMLVGRMLEPLGMIMLAYATLVTRNRLLLLAIAGVCVVQIGVGFIGDSKEIAMRAPLIFIVATFLLRGRIAKGWLAAMVVFAVVVFPVFEAYRAEVMHVRGMTRAEAASNLWRSVELALGARDKVERKFNDEYESPGFLKRTSLKPTLETLIAKTGDVAPFQHGYTIGLFFTGFVPRYFWPDKPDSSVGQLMNRQFHVSEDRDTYISATHLGELYWNFGYAGIFVGMLCLGAMLASINVRCDLTERRTLTRLLILITTVYAAIVRFEGSIALEYIVFVRSLVMIGVLHLVFARVPVGGSREDGESGRAPGRDAGAAPRPLIDAPQLLR